MTQLFLEHRFAHGLFADIFAPPPGDKAYKLFRRIDDPQLAHVAPYVLRAEVSAYEIVARHPALLRYAPAFFGTTAVGTVLDKSGRDMSDSYWLEVCYVMQRLEPDPEERKFGSFFETPDWSIVEPLEQVFEAAGIQHLGDASVFYWRSANPVLIDFAVSDAAANHARL